MLQDSAIPNDGADHKLDFYSLLAATAALAAAAANIPVRDDGDGDDSDY